MRPRADRARAKADHHVTGPRLFTDKPLQIVLAHYRPRVPVAMPDEPGDEIFARRSRDRIFACRENLSDADYVRIIEAGAKVLE